MCIIHDNTCNEIVAIQEKTQLYKDHTLGNNFIPLAIKIYGCLHLCFNFFYFLCLAYYSPSFVIFINSHDAYFLLSVTCVHSPLSNNHNQMNQW
jgi:hypothetical protein